MTQVRIAELKSHLSAYLRRVRQGDEVLVMDRETPIAKLVPVSPAKQWVVVIPAKKPYAPMKLLPPPKKSFDILKYLEEERKDRDFF